MAAQRSLLIEIFRGFAGQLAYSRVAAHSVDLGLGIDSGIDSIMAAGIVDLGSVAGASDSAGGPGGAGVRRG